MKPQALLTGLACLTFGLVGAIAYVQRPTGPTGVAQAAAPEPVQGKAELATPTPKTNQTELVAKKGAPFSWREVESEDYKQYIANLRGIGCPEQTIRDIILADINKLYAAREEPLKNKPKGAPETPETSEQKLERLTQLRAVQQEKRWAVKELLGIDLPLDLLPSSGSRDYESFEVAWRYLPVEKRDAVQSLQETYWQQSDALKAKFDKKRPPEYTAEARQLTSTLQQELAKVLTPQELEDYNIRTSSEAKQMSTKLATYFQPSEDEFRKIYRAKRDYDAAIEQISTPKGAPVTTTDPAERQALAQQRATERQAQEEARAAAVKQMNEELKANLGEQRFNGYERSQDRTYDLLARLGMRYNIPEEKVLEAYETQKSFKPPQPVPGQQIDQAALQRQLNEQLTSILGEQAARGYRRVNGGTVPIRN
ncbi:MAG: hypothetical protein U1G07_08050 [Verrucomicrobiota bacterium]